MWSGVHQLQRLADFAVRAGARHPVSFCGLVGFLAGVAVDVDHVPAVLFGLRTGFVPLAIVPQIGEGRNLHGVALAFGGLGCACAGGYLVFLVLSDPALWLTIRRIRQRIRRSMKNLGPGGVERSERRSERFTEFREDTFKLGGQGGQEV